MLQLHESALKQLAVIKSEGLDRAAPKDYEGEATPAPYYCPNGVPNPASSAGRECSSNLESPEYLAHRLLVEFGKTRTNYNSLVPRIVEVMRLYRDYGPIRCPVPVVSNLEELLNDEALLRIEHRYPNSLDAGFLVLCTERRALRSGGGGKYYFIDVSGRLVGCHKSDLPVYAEKGILRGPVLLKNLIFVFIMRGAFRLDPRCKSSNPQRLLEYYENLAKEGKAMDVQRLVRVWSMEVFPEAPYDAGFPHCSLLWVKRMHVGAHITKWKRSQWHTNQLRAHDAVYSSRIARHHIPFLRGMHQPSYLHTATATPRASDIYGAYRDGDDLLCARSKRRRMNEKVPTTPGCLSSMPFDRWAGVTGIGAIVGSSNVTAEGYPATGDGGGPASTFSLSSDFLSDASNVQALFSAFHQFAPALQVAEIMEWSVEIIEKLSCPVLTAALQLIRTSFQGSGSNEKEETQKDEKALQSAVVRAIYGLNDRDKMAESLRILLACLIQQQRLEEFLPTVRQPHGDVLQLSPDDFYNVFVKLERNSDDQAGQHNSSAACPTALLTGGIYFHEPETSSTAESGGTTSSSTAHGAYRASPSKRGTGDGAYGELDISPAHRRDDALGYEELWKSLTLKKEDAQRAADTVMAELLCHTSWPGLGTAQTTTALSSSADDGSSESIFYRGHAAARKPSKRGLVQPGTTVIDSPLLEHEECCDEVDVSEYTANGQRIPSHLTACPALPGLIPPSLTPLSVLPPCQTSFRRPISISDSIEAG